MYKSHPHSEIIHFMHSMLILKQAHLHLIIKEFFALHEQVTVDVIISRCVKINNKEEKYIGI